MHGRRGPPPQPCRPGAGLDGPSSPSGASPGVRAAGSWLDPAVKTERVGPSTGCARGAVGLSPCTRCRPRFSGEAPSSVCGSGDAGPRAVPGVVAELERRTVAPRTVAFSKTSAIRTEHPAGVPDKPGDHGVRTGEGDRELQDTLVPERLLAPRVAVVPE